jgi:hypothetical protein
VHSTVAAGPADELVDVNLHGRWVGKYMAIMHTKYLPHPTRMHMRDTL